jgi:hypothetical protein
MMGGPGSIKQGAGYDGDLPGREGLPLAGERASKSIRHYFVDEAGDPILFNRRKQVVVGKEGCSSFFILGVLDIENPSVLADELQGLRARLLADPYFRGVPSMQAEERKTARAFHAKDDLPEIRREVFRILLTHKMRFFAVVREKLSVLAYVRQRNERESEYRYNPNELYDSLIRRLFRDRLHQDEGYRVCFARRGSSDRTAALSAALERARANFARKWGILGDGPIAIEARQPWESVGLQAADYFLWALQRAYERGESRYIEYLRNLCSLVHDVDDTRGAKYGVYYSRKRPLTLAAIQRRKSGI